MVTRFSPHNHFSSAGYLGYQQPQVLGYDAQLAETGRGTVAGEYLRRYWHPVALTSQLHDRPLALQVLSEKLVLFCTTQGEYGLVHRYCPHRRASLEYGKCETTGIRCCYHGWLFAPNGEVLETPGEQQSSASAQRVRERSRIGAYPVMQYRGLVFAYLGPIDKIPEFPYYDAFDTPDIEVRPYRIEYKCNWIQVLDAIMDPLHTAFLHGQISQQFSVGLAEVGELQFFQRGQQFLGACTRRVDDHVWVRVNELILPNFTQAGAAFGADGTQTKLFGRSSFTRWVVPVDDHHCVALAWANFGARGDPAEYNNQAGCELIEQGERVDRPYEEKQRRPADAEAVEGMGSISSHAGEHLMATDKGIALYRRALRSQMEALELGSEPPQPQQQPGQSVRTYGQDTVLQMGPREDDATFLKALGDKVLKLQFEHESLPLAERDAAILTALDKLQKQPSI